MKTIILLTLTATSIFSYAAERDKGTSLLEVDLSSPLKGECLEYRTEFRSTRTDVMTFLERVQNRRGLVEVHDSTLGIPFSIKGNIDKIDYISTGNNRVGVLTYKCLKYNKPETNNNTLLNLKINPRNGSCINEKKVLRDTMITTEELKGAIGQKGGFEFEDMLRKADEVAWHSYSQKVSNIEFIETDNNEVGLLLNYCKDSIFKEVLNGVEIGENDNADREAYAKSQREFQERIALEISQERLSRVQYRYIYNSNNVPTKMQECRSGWDFISNGAIFRRTKKDCSSFTIVGDGGVLRYRGSL